MGLDKSCFNLAFDERRKWGAMIFVLPGTILDIEYASKQGLSASGTLDANGNFAALKSTNEGAPSVFNFFLRAVFVSHKKPPRKMCIESWLD